VSGEACLASNPLWDVHVTIALIGAVAAVLTSWLSSRNHNVLKRIDRATNGHDRERETWRSSRGV
jgi:hypothetical protein